MDKPWLDILPQIGATGLLAWVMYTLAMRFITAAEVQTKEIINQMSLRIEANERRLDMTEKRLETCEADRSKLHQQFAEFLLRETHEHPDR